LHVPGKIGQFVYEYLWHRPTKEMVSLHYQLEFTLRC
jgi:hypothetical protein